MVSNDGDKKGEVQSPLNQDPSKPMSNAEQIKKLGEYAEKILAASSKFPPAMKKAFDDLNAGMIEIQKQQQEINKQMAKINAAFVGVSAGLVSAATNQKPSTTSQPAQTSQRRDNTVKKLLKPWPGIFNIGLSQDLINVVSEERRGDRIYIKKKWDKSLSDEQNKTIFGTLARKLEEYGFVWTGENRNKRFEVIA